MLFRSWSTGRYGFLFSSDLSTNPADAFTGYTVKPLTRSAGEKILLLTDDFEDIAVSKSNWNLPQEDIPGFQFVDGAVILTNNWLQSQFSPMRNAEVTLDMEFLNNSNGPFSVYSPLGVFEFTSDGNWNFRGVDFFQSSNGEPSPSINADKNVVTYRFFDGQFTFIANGETVATFDDLSYNEALLYLDPSSTAVKIGASADSQIKIDNLSLSTISSAFPVPESPSLPNQVVLPQFTPGDAIFSFSGIDLRYDMWCPGNHNPHWFGPCLTPAEPLEEIINPSVKDMHYWYDKQYLNDTPVEMSFETTFSSKTGAIGLMCRYTQLGRYEFVIQPDGSWAIRQNTAYWYAPKASNITVLAQGKSDVIRPDVNQLNAICQGNELIFNANGTELGRVKDDLYPEGYVGFFFDAYTAGSFTNLGITVPE